MRGEWWKTGDVGYRDADGYLWFVGRKDDVISSAGHRIGPGEIEDSILKHPAVLQVAVVGSPDDLRGEVVKAFIILNSDFEESDDLVTELKDFSKHITAPYKYPRKIEFVTELPKTVSGKIQRNLLRRRVSVPTVVRNSESGERDCLAQKKPRERGV